MRLLIIDRMNTHDRHENRHLVPSGQQLRGLRLPLEPSGITGDISSPSLLPTNKISGLCGQRFPSLVLISSPHSCAQSLQPEGVIPIDGQESARRILLAKQIKFCLSPMVGCEIGRLTLVVPPKINSICDVVSHLLLVPRTNFRDRKVQITIASISNSSPIPLWVSSDKPVLRTSHVKKSRVAQTRFPNASEAHPKVAVIVRQL
mmetsp:Transcript_46253/g.100510  ORF Transcript_46253/g.100510 Transcript_46253/m.100510 type:complete len:204 (-) Transcript_46253:1003-1614(-)